MKNKTLKDKSCGRDIIRFDIPNQVCGKNGWLCFRCKELENEK